MNSRDNEYKCLESYKRLLREFDQVINSDCNSQYARYTLEVARSIIQAFTEQTEQEMDDSVRLTSKVVLPRKL